eukprot:m.75824 g.75824  ORF g.75824 m.75824 type:complete len:206 (+) comp9021_c0_seq3:40-657(+)
MVASLPSASSTGSSGASSAVPLQQTQLHHPTLRELVARLQHDTHIHALAAAETEREVEELRLKYNSELAKTKQYNNRRSIHVRRASSLHAAVQTIISDNTERCAEVDLAQSRVDALHRTKIALRKELAELKQESAEGLGAAAASANSLTQVALVAGVHPKSRISKQNQHTSSPRMSSARSSQTDSSQGDEHHNGKKKSRVVLLAA